MKLNNTLILFEVIYQINLLFLSVSSTTIYIFIISWTFSFLSFLLSKLWFLMVTSMFRIDCSPQRQTGNHSKVYQTISCPIKLFHFISYGSAKWNRVWELFADFRWSIVCLTSIDPSKMCARVTAVIQVGLEPYTCPDKP